MAKTIYPRDERKAQFITTGIKLAKKAGLANVSVSAVAKEHKVTAPLIFHVFGTRAAFHSAVKAAAKKQGVTLDTAAKPAPKRKRSIAEVKAIKNKVAAKPKAIVAAKPKAKAKPAPVPKAKPKAKAKPKPKATKNAGEVRGAPKPRVGKTAGEAIPKSTAFAPLPVPSVPVV